MRVKPVKPVHFERLAAKQVGVELVGHCLEIEVRIHDDPVVLAIGPRDKSVQAHGAAVANLPHPEPPSSGLLALYRRCFDISNRTEAPPHRIKPTSAPTPFKPQDAPLVPSSMGRTEAIQ